MSSPVVGDIMKICLLNTLSYNQVIYELVMAHVSDWPSMAKAIVMRQKRFRT